MIFAHQQYVGLQLVGFAIGVLSYPLGASQKMIVWPINVVNTCLSSYLHHKKGMHALLGMDFCYMLFNVYGWYQWYHKPNQKRRSITQLNHQEKRWLLGWFIVGTVIFSFLFLKMGWQHPYLNACFIPLTFSGQWMSARKKYPTYLCWGICNVFSILQHWYAALWFVSLKFICYLPLCYYGHIKWHQAWQQNVEVTTNE